ncbi:MAG: ketopantoate reductase family protein [Candidatus Hermodarchaeota archaeon]|nr:ketopantoate reductase family protein [Candidatus Hermodarchaeota archaeon]
MTFNQIFILGAGAIGSVYGAFLSQNTPVILVGRPAHMDAIKEKGLVLISDGAGTYVKNITPITLIDKIPSKTLLLVTVKAVDLEEALTSIAPLIQEDTVLLLLQNGLGIEEITRKVTNGKGTVIRGIVETGAEMVEPGRVKVCLNSTIFDSDKDSKQVAKLFQTSGLDAVISDSFQTAVWRKVTINCYTNPLSAILHVPTATLVSPHLSEIQLCVVEECIAVGAAEGVKIDLNLIQLMNQNLPRYTNQTSMLQDIERGRKTEIDFLNGKIVELGKKHNIQTPVNECIAQLVRFKESA